MKKFLFLLLGLIIGVIITLAIIKYFKIPLFSVSSLQVQLDTSSSCGGELQKAMYCYKGYFCEMKCNLCNCDAPYCQINSKMCTQPK
jgi:hypothetical protein